MKYRKSRCSAGHAIVGCRSWSQPSSPFDAISDITRWHFVGKADMYASCWITRWPRGAMESRFQPLIHLDMPIIHLEDNRSGFRWFSTPRHTCSFLPVCSPVMIAGVRRQQLTVSRASTCYVIGADNRLLPPPRQRQRVNGSVGETDYSDDNSRNNDGDDASRASSMTSSSSSASSSAEETCGEDDEDGENATGKRTSKSR